MMMWTLSMVTAGLLTLTGCLGGSVPELEHQSLRQASWDQAPAMRARIDPASFDAARMRAALFYASNEARRRAGKEPLTRSAALEGSAQLHAERMTQKEFFSHTDPHSARLRTPNDRAAHLGVANPMLAENIALEMAIEYESGRPVYKRGGPGQFSYTPDGPVLPAYTYASMARAVVGGWMRSPGHRRNLLDPKARELGCGADLFWRGDFPAVHTVQNFQLYEPITMK